MTVPKFDSKTLLDVFHTAPSRKLNLVKLPSIAGPAPPTTLAPAMVNALRTPLTVIVEESNKRAAMTEAEFASVVAVRLELTIRH